jgi:hypothetical protein
MTAVPSALSSSSSNLLSASSGPNMQDKEVDQIVLGYLKKRGFRQTELTFKNGTCS